MSYKSKVKEEIEANKKNAYGYIRVSDVSQIDNQSLTTQHSCIVKYCIDNNLELKHIYADEGKSGMSTNGRDDFLDLIKIVKPGNFVVVYELSRFARDQKDLIDNFRDLVRNKSCTFICLNPFIDSRQPQSDLMIGIYSSVAQEESNRTSSRVKSNMDRLSVEGKLLTRPPFGYVHDAASRKYLPDEQQQEILRQLEIWYELKVSLSEMAKRLNDDGRADILNNNKKTKIVDPRFSYSTIAGILRGYKIIKEDNDTKFSYHERVANWNNTLHKPKKKYEKELNASTSTSLHM